MMFWKPLASLAALFVYLCLTAPPAVSQEGSDAAETLAIEGTSFPVTFKSEEIPLFSVVSTFFRRIWMVRNNASVSKKLLTDIGIDPDSHAAEFLASLTDQAIVILDAKTVDGRLTGEAFMEHQYTALREKARKLGIVYRNLLLGLEEAGISLDLVETYCEQTIRPSISVFSTDIDNTRYLESVAEFEKQLEGL